jgi:hypothetical protein
MTYDSVVGDANVNLASDAGVSVPTPTFCEASIVTAVVPLVCRANIVDVSAVLISPDDALALIIDAIIYSPML